MKQRERDGARKREREGGGKRSRWRGPGEHFIFLIDNNGFINDQSFHRVHTVHHWLEFCGRAKKPKIERQGREEREKEKKTAGKVEKIV